MAQTLVKLSAFAWTALGQVPDLREGDCVTALAEIEYEYMPKVEKGMRGMVTGKGISWEKRDWAFTDAKVPLLKQRNAVIHRSMVEKISETEGYGAIQQTGTDQCLTVFEFDNGQASQIKFWECVPGWTEQMFVYPSCGEGPGQIRWVKDPLLCLKRTDKLILSDCEWSVPFIFKLANVEGLTAHLQSSEAVPEAVDETAGKMGKGKGKGKADKVDSTKKGDVPVAPVCISGIDDDFTVRDGTQQCARLFFPGKWHSAEMDPLIVF